jgi:hypothetical protein
MPSNHIETLTDILQEWSRAEREPDKRALWRKLARGGWLQVCRNAVHRKERVQLTTWLEHPSPDIQDIVEFNGAEAAQLTRLHLHCALAACAASAQILPEASRGFCRDLMLLLSGAQPRSAEREVCIMTLLVDTARNEGVVATLTLELLTDGQGELYPTPELAFLRDADFQQAEATACAALQATPFWSHHHDVRWRLQRRDGKPVTNLSGPSMGAAFALGMGRLLAEHR